MATPRRPHPRIIVAVVLLALVVIVVLQNTEPVATRFLFATVTMPRALLLVLALLVGFALGLLAARARPRLSGPGRRAASDRAEGDAAS